MPWLVIVLHEPPYTTGLHAPAARPPAGLIPPIADLFEVDLVLSGHDHNYQRTHPVRGGEILDGWQEPDFRSPRGTIYVVSGGGGTWLYQFLEGAPDERLFSVFRDAHHAVELEFTTTRLRLRAHRRHFAGGVSQPSRWRSQAYLRSDLAFAMRTTQAVIDAHGDLPRWMYASAAGPAQP